MEKATTTETISSMEAAQELETTHLRILMLIKEGILDGAQEGAEWYVTRTSIDSFRSHDGDVRASVKCSTACGGNCANHGA